jgi:alpha-ketoglutarate-dependent taurine dioxygenase
MKKPGGGLWAERRKSARPTAISVTGEGLVKLSTLGEGGTLPLVIEPRVEGLSLPLWAAENVAFIESRLLGHGGLLFRNFDVRTQGDFEAFLDALGLPQMVYMEAATPRTKLSEKVYTSTEFPPEQTIALHNELSYVNIFPMKIWFYCLQPAERGGETPIGDVRGVYQRVPAAIRERFIDRGWLLARNFGGGFGPTWRHSYHVDDAAAAERYFREAGIEFEWLGGERLRTKQARPAVARHPRTGEAVWFNHIAFWHVSSLDARLREMLLAEFGEEGLPYNTYYGDGSPIEESVIEELREAYRQETVSFPWRQGDALMLDNMLTAHGRAPFEGRRRVLAAMGEPLRRTDI